VVAEAAGELADEIGTTLEFFRGSADEQPVSRVLLSGAGSLLSGFDEQLAARLDLPVGRLDVRGHVKAPGRLHLTELDEADAAGLAVPAGLCAAAAVGAGR
jgi:Tfp pilus assembly PilM family ATPase